MKKIKSCFIVILAVSVLIITCSNPVESEKPELNVNPTSCTFTKNTNTQILIISNNGNGELSWEINNKPVWLEVSKSSGKITTGRDTVISTANLDQGAGEYSGTMNITSNGGNKEIIVSLNISIWVKKKNIPTARVAHAVATLNGQIYALGGFYGENNIEVRLSSVEAYNPVTNNWIAKRNLPYEKSHFSCCSLNEKIYAIGGWHDWVSLLSVAEYNPETDIWVSKSPLPSGRWGHDNAVVNGKIYVIGGARDWPVTEYAESVEEYDPQTDTWTTKSPMPSKRWGLSCSVVNGKIYVIGGCSGSTGRSTVEEYDPATDTWTTKSSMPTARFALFTGVVDNKIYAISGGDVYPVQNCLKTVEEYDPATDTWTTKSSIPAGRVAIGQSSESIDGKIYIIGGRGLTINEVYSDVFEYEPGLDTLH